MRTYLGKMFCQTAHRGTEIMERQLFTQCLVIFLQSLQQQKQYLKQKEHFFYLDSISSFMIEGLVTHEFILNCDMTHSVPVYFPKEMR